MEQATGMNRSDWLAIAAKGLLGSAPFVGPLVAEIVGNLIPNQRLDRLSEFIGILEEKLKSIEQEVLRERFREQAFSDFFEDGLIDSIRASSTERRERIANVVAHGVLAQDVDFSQERHILWLLREINDVELLILYGHDSSLIGEMDFWKKHGEVVSGPSATSGAPQEKLDRYAIHQSYKNHLVQLGLLRPTFKNPRKGELPEFDHRTGMIKASGHDVTQLGRLLLRRVGLLQGSS